MYLNCVSLCRWAVKVFRVDNRKILGMTYVVCFVGAVLTGDWQAVNQEDPCSLPGSNSVCENSTFSGMQPQLLGSGLSCGVGENVSEFHKQLVCEEQICSGHQCFWNPQSQVTGECCSTCLPVCLSQQTTINFYQFTLGILLISFAAPLAFVVVSAMASDIAPVTSQVSTYLATL